MLQCKFDPGSYVYNDSFVSIVRAAWDTPANALGIHDNLHDKFTMEDFTLCNSEILHNYTDYHRFVEWMELNIILGVEKVIIFISQIDEIMTTVLKSYSTDGILEVVDLSGLVPNVWKYASFVTLQECLFRTMLKTKYLLYLDIDEIIAPRQPKLFKLSEMIIAGKCVNRTYISALNYFFHPDWPNDAEYENNDLVQNKLRLMTLLKTQREPNFLRFENRSRFLIRPENVDRIKPHKVWLRHANDEFPCVVHPDIGALHHYDKIVSIQSNGSDLNMTNYTPIYPYKRKETEVRDHSLHKYAEILIERTTERHVKLGYNFEY